MGKKKRLRKEKKKYAEVSVNQDLYDRIKEELENLDAVDRAVLAFDKTAPESLCPSFNELTARLIDQYAEATPAPRGAMILDALECAYLDVSQAPAGQDDLSSPRELFDDTDAIAGMLDEHGWSLNVPPIEEGFMQGVFEWLASTRDKEKFNAAKADGFDLVFWWQLLDVDIDEQTTSIRIIAARPLPDIIRTERTKWLPYADMHIKFSPQREKTADFGGFSIGVDVDASLIGPDIFKEACVPGWQDVDYEAFRITIDNLLGEKKIKGVFKTVDTAAAFVGSVCAHAFRISNLVMKTSKHSNRSLARAKKASDCKIICRADAAPTSRVHTYTAEAGAISLVTAPDVDIKTIRSITYSMPTWNVRGHVRHLANGKTIYIKPQKRVRHGLEASAENAPASKTVIKIKKGESE